MRYTIHLLKGVNDIEFGMAADAVRERMAGDFDTFHNPYTSGEDRCPIDAYSELGVYCHYDAAGYLDAVDFWEPAQALVNGVDWLALTTAQSSAELLRLDPLAILTPDGVCSTILSIAIQVSDEADHDNALVQSVFVGRPGYFDRYNQSGGKWWLPAHH